MENLEQAMAALDQAAASYTQTRDDDASKRVQKLRTDLGDLKSLIGARKVSDALSAIDSADRDVLRAKQAAFGRAVVQTCARHGIRLKSLPAPQRQRKVKPKTEPEAPNAIPQQTSSEAEGSATDKGKKSGGVFGLGRRSG